MLGRASGVAAATCALVANAILLPPGINSIDDSLSSQTDAVESRLVWVPCSECAFSATQEHAEGVDDSSDDAFQIQGGANEILLNFTTSDDSRRLELNGATIYPMQSWSKEQTVIVHQVPAVGPEDVKVPLQVTSSGLLMDYAQPAQEEANALVTLRYTVLGLEKQLMQLQAVKIELLKVGDELLILSAGIDATDDEPAHHGSPGVKPHAGGPPAFGALPPPETVRECNMLPAPVCRFKHLLEAKIAHMRHRKPCPDRMGPPRGPPHFRPYGVAHGERPHPHHGRPHHMKPWHRHHGYHHHGHQRHWVTAFARGFVAVLLPVVAGISVGLTVSLLGLATGRLITFVWMRLSRNRARGSAGVMRENEYVEESKGLMLADEDEDEGEALPAYEDAPGYEETVAKLSY